MNSIWGIDPIHAAENVIWWYKWPGGQHGDGPGACPVLQVLATEKSDTGNSGHGLMCERPVI